MKSFLAVVLLAAYLVACTQALPGFRRNGDTDIVAVIPGDAMGSFGMRADDSLDSDESAEGWMPSIYSNSFGGGSFNGFMAQAMKRLKEHMNSVLSRVLDKCFGEGIVNNIPEGANTTYTTKVIHGHVVNINETTYLDGDVLVRVRVVDVIPQNETILRAESEEGGVEITTLPAGAAEEESTTAARSVETVEDFENELPKDQIDTLTA